MIEALERVKGSFNSYPLDRLAIAGAVAAFEDLDYFESTRQAVVRSRNRLVRELCVLGFEVLPSAANFVFIRHPFRGAGGTDGGAAGAAYRRTPFQSAADRAIHAHHHRHRRSVPGFGGRARGYLAVTALKAMAPDFRRRTARRAGESAARGYVVGTGPGFCRRLFCDWPSCPHPRVFESPHWMVMLCGHLHHRLPAGFRKLAGIAARGTRAGSGRWPGCRNPRH